MEQHGPARAPSHPNEPGYLVVCHACQTPYDATQAQWCACLTTMRTLVCPTCSACSCAAPKAYRDQFWAKAPAALCAARFEEKQRAFDPPPRPAPRQVKRPLVVVADDERVILRLASSILDSLGFSVLTARDGAEALEMTRTYKPDLLLADALMPKMDGREVCRRLKEDAATASVKVIIMSSAYTAAKYKTEALSHFKADAFVTKPVDFKVLQELLMKHIG